MGSYVMEEMLDWSEDLNTEVTKLKNGATVIDCGVKEDGGYEAGLYLARLCLADLADLQYTTFDLKGLKWPAIQIATDNPVIACMASQYAGWRISVGDYFGMGSGPARALALKPKELYKEIGYHDDFQAAILFIESNRLPDERVVEYIAKHCSVDPENVMIAVAPTASIAGSVQISARVVETGIHKFKSIGFDINCIKSGYGIAPIAPIVGNDIQCMGSTNDCVIYGGETNYTVCFNGELAELEELVQKVPSTNSHHFGKPFYQTFKEAGFDFYKVNEDIFAPARLNVNDLKNKKTISSGEIYPEILFQSFGIRHV
jgi:methenyltetrahydromethanopterin cyclohydrolase